MRIGEFARQPVDERGPRDDEPACLLDEWWHDENDRKCDRARENRIRNEHRRERRHEAPQRIDDGHDEIRNEDRGEDDDA